MIFNLGIALPLISSEEYTQFWDSFHVMRKPDHVYLRPDYPGPPDVVRNELVKKAFESGCSHLVMMDTDQIYPIDALEKMQLLFQNPEVKVVSTIVYRRYVPFDPLVFFLVDNGNGEINMLRVTDEQLFTPGIIRVDATGTGCIMFDMEVFNAIPAPWFVDEAYMQARKKKGLEEVVLERRKPGEDIGFCYKLHEKGIKIWVDTTIGIDHLSLVAINRASYTLYRKLNSLREET